jgi:hypothetical protein
MVHLINKNVLENIFGTTHLFPILGCTSTHTHISMCSNIIEVLCAIKLNDSKGQITL